MPRPPAPPLRIESLEGREVPAAVAAAPPAAGFVEGFEAIRPPAVVPDGWRVWVNSTAAAVAPTADAPAGGATALAAAGGRYTVSRVWNHVTLPADTAAAASVRADGPALVLARGHRLESSAPSFVGATVRPDGRVELVEARHGAVRAVAGVTAEAAPPGWLRVTVRPTGGAAAVRVQRLDTGAFLAADGRWQAGPADAVRGAVGWNPAGGGQVGVGRPGGGAGAVAFDDVTAAPPVVREGFDAAPAGGLPAGWAGWASDAAPGFGATAARSLSAGQGLGSAGNSPSRSRAWLADRLPADVQASAAVYTDTLVPAGLVVRGLDLDTPTPTYYGLTVTRGLDVRLTKAVGGAEVTLAAVRSAGYVSGQWVRLTLTADADRLRAVVFRADTGQWLSADGTWLDYPDSALAVTDNTIAGDGLVGLARHRAVAGTVVFDDFEVRPAAGGGPVPAVAASQPLTAAVAGDLTFAADTDPAAAARRVEFRLDGRLRAAVAGGRGQWAVDTRTLANGPHELVVRAVDGGGNDGAVTIRFEVFNADPLPPIARPDLGRKLPHIRIAQLAYDGNPLGDFERQKLRDAVDLVVPNGRYLAAIDAVAPDTPQLIYSNVSNLYGGLLTDWLAFADRTGADREAAFYHAARPVPWEGNSPSSRPVTHPWAVARGPAAGGGPVTDLTAAARGGRASGVAFGGAGEAVAVGFPDRFRELDVDLVEPAGPGWAAVPEYAAAVDPAGNVTAWKPLPLLADGTAGLAATGRLAFDPPADWVAGTAAGGGRLYYVRWRVTAGAAADAPQARTVLGRDYVGANGGTRGTIPAFDAAADADADGYLTDAEYATRAAGMDARFAHESRVFYPYYGQMRFAVNPSPLAVRRWAADFHTRQLANSPLADGFFIDNATGRLPVRNTPVVEATASFTDDYAALTEAVSRAVSPKLVFSNTAGGGADGIPVTAAGAGAVEEFVLRPLEATWAQVYDVANMVASRLGADDPAPYLVLDTYTSSAAPSDPRAQAAALAYYYLVADPDRTMLMFFGGQIPSAAWQDTWIAAAEVDVGRPTGGLTEVATGADPADPRLTYRVFGRDYEKGKVLYKPLSYQAGAGTGGRSDGTATTHELGGSYRVVAADGRVGPVVTRVTLRNGEGVVLLKA